MTDGYLRTSTFPLLLLALVLGAGCSSTSEPTNHAPTVQISEPAGALTVPESSAVIFKGSGTDAEDGTLAGAQLSWSSSVSGALGTGDSIRVTTLSVGNHVVTLTGEDAKGLTGTATVSITVTPFVPGNQPPQVTISAPANGTSVSQGTAVVFIGSALDPENGAMTGTALVWTSSLDGALGTGLTVTDTLSVGQHTITLRATDDSGAHTDATITVTVHVAVPTLGFDTIATGLSSPIFVTAAPGDTTRLFVVEQTGKIRIILNGVLQATPFLDLSDPDSIFFGGEQGLLGLAFAPDYATSGRFFVDYTAKGGGGAGHAAIARFQRSTADAADPTSKAVILTNNDPYTNHNGGMLAFGPNDGYLYFGLGDGGGGNDPLNSGQNPNDFFGSMLRLDVSGSSYTIPPSNPFATSPTAAHEVWNFGLRNPWRWSFDRLTGDLYIGDVGQDVLEEIDVQPAASPGGVNYGWSIMEGFQCRGGGNGCTQTGTLPVLDYDHSNGCAVVGGYVYRGTAIAGLAGTYFYSDNCSSFMRSFRWTGTGITESKSWPALENASGISSFGEDNAGELYVTDLGSGMVYKIVPR